MNEQEKRVRLAELLGWQNPRVLWPDESWLPGDQRMMPPGYAAKWALMLRPDWWNDLNAAHALGEEMQRRGLTNEYTQAILTSLSHAKGEATYTSAMLHFDLLQASAAVRADAALSVLEKEKST